MKKMQVPPPTQVLTPQCTVTLTLMSVQVMVANQTLVTGSEAAEEADQEELTQASDLSVGNQA